MKRTVFVAAGLIMGGLAALGATIAVGEDQGSPSVVEQALQIVPRQGECSGTTYLSYGENATGSPTPLDAIQRLYPDESGLIEEPVGTEMLKVFARYDGDDRASAFKVANLGTGENPRWVVLQGTQSEPCGGIRDPFEG